jgi:hypothetical protein
MSAARLGLKRRVDTVHAPESRVNAPKHAKQAARRFFIAFKRVFHADKPTSAGAIRLILGPELVSLGRSSYGRRD